MGFLPTVGLCDYLELQKFDCLCDDYWVKIHFVPQTEESDLPPSMPMEASTRKQRFDNKKTAYTEGPILQQSPSDARRSCDYLELWKFDCLYDESEVKTHFVPQIQESNHSQSVPMEASTRKEPFEREKVHPRRYSFCNNPPQTSEGDVIVGSFGNSIVYTMTMGSKHTSFPKLKNQTSPKVGPWKRQLARSDLREKKSIRGGTHFAIIPLKRPESV